MKVVTLRRLKALGACAGALVAFERAFGKSVEVTPANLTKARRVLRAFDNDPLGWLAQKVAPTKYGTARLAVVEMVHKGATEGRCPKCRALRRVSRDVLLGVTR